MASMRFAAVAVATATAILAGASGAGATEYSERVLAAQTVQINDLPLGAPVLVIEGSQNATDRRLYDIKFAVQGQPMHTVSAFTGGTASAPMRFELVNPAILRSNISAKLTYRYDAAQPVCLVGVDGTCKGSLPLDPSNAKWLVGSPRADWGQMSLDSDPRDWRLPSARNDMSAGAGAELILELVASTAGASTATHTIRVPFLGQVVGGVIH